MNYVAYGCESCRCLCSTKLRSTNKVASLEDGLRRGINKTGGIETKSTPKFKYT